MKSNTAIDRNFVRTPTVIAFFAFVASWMFLCSIFLPLNPHKPIQMLIAILIGIGCLKGVESLGDWLVKLRFISWAKEFHDIGPDKFEEFFDNLEPDDLEKMVAIDLEGWEEET